MVSKRLAREDVRQMNLDARNRASQQRIEQRDRSVGEGAGIDNQPRALRPRFLDPGHEFALVVALAKCDREPERCRLTLASDAQIVERFPAVNLGLTGPKQVEIGTVQHVNRLGHGGLETLDTARLARVRCARPGMRDWPLYQLFGRSAKCLRACL